MPDEPANNLDIPHPEKGTMAINDFQGKGIVVLYGKHCQDQASVKQTIKV